MSVQESSDQMLARLRDELEHTKLSLRQKKAECDELKLTFALKEESFEVSIKQRDEQISQFKSVVDTSKNYELLKQLQSDLASAEETILRLKKASVIQRKSTFSSAKGRLSMINLDTHSLLKDLTREIKDQSVPGSQRGSTLSSKDGESVEKEESLTYNLKLNDKIRSLIKSLENEENLRFEATAHCEKAEKKLEELQKAHLLLKNNFTSLEQVNNEINIELTGLRVSEKDYQIALEKEKLRSKDLEERLRLFEESRTKNEETLVESEYLKNKVNQLNSEIEILGKEAAKTKREFEFQLENSKKELNIILFEKEEFAKQTAELRKTLALNQEQSIGKENRLKGEHETVAKVLEEKVDRLEQELIRTKLSLKSLKLVSEEHIPQDIESIPDTEMNDIADLNEIDQENLMELDVRSEEDCATSSEDIKSEASPLELANENYGRALDEISRKNAELSKARAELIALREKKTDGEQNEEADFLKLTVKHLGEKLELVGKSRVIELERSERKVDELNAGFVAQKLKLIDEIEAQQAKIDNLLKQKLALQIQIDRNVKGTDRKKI